MKKKNLIILLVIPFIIALLGIITINASFNTFYGDLTSIEWDYSDVEGFSTNVNRYELRATGKNSSDAPLDSGNQLVWRVTNKDPNILDPLAEIEVVNGSSFLIPKGEGEVIITCSNLKGNIFKRMTAVLYSSGAIIITPTIKGSQMNIDPNIYYGEFDLDGTSRIPASISLELKCMPEDLINNIKIESSSNLNVSRADNSLTADIIPMFNDSDAFIRLSANDIVGEYSFKIVEDGVNVYTYDDLLNCTNKSENGEIVVLRKSFESYNNYISKHANNVVQFGQSNTNKFDFSNDVYRYKTTYNNEYIKQWNEFASTTKGYKPISDECLAGLRIQKDFYGNGYTINMHNLTYPSLITEVEVDGRLVKVPTLGANDLFRGPRPLYTLGDYNKLPLITAYGEDNSAIYVDGDNITINDINLKSCDMPASLSFLETVGSACNIHGDNIVIKNSELSNSKSVVRSFSSMNLLIDNSLLSNSLNFLVETGSNEYVKYDELNKFDFNDDKGSPVKMTLTEYLAKGSKGDLLLESFLMGKFKNKDEMRESLYKIQDALNPREMVEGLYKGSMTINDTYFYHSGLSAIAFNNLFNGPFLYSKAPSKIEEIFNQFEYEGAQIAPYIASKVTGLSYPVTVDITGDTRFYDYKVAADIDLGGLIDENISRIASEVLGEDKNISIDDVFPIKNLLLKEGSKPENNNIIDGNINILCAYYGGSLNLSTISFDGMKMDVNRSSLKIDFLDEYLNLTSSSDNTMSMIKDVMVKCVTVVTGFEPFEFICVSGNDYLYNQSPSVDDLILNARRSDSND